MKITSIEAIIVDLPVIRPHKLAMATIYKHSMIIVRVSTDEGVTGLGEIAIIPHYGEEAPTAVKAIIDECLAPILIGHDPRRFEQLVLFMDTVIKGNNYAKGGIEMACVDATAKSLNVPASQLFGSMVTERLPLLWVLGNGKIEPDLAEAEQKLDEGSYRLFLVKIGHGDPRENVNRALTIKKSLGDRASVRVDVNQGWDEATAAWGIERLQDGGIDVIEQPVPRANIDAMKRLTQRFSVPIMADEAVATMEDAMAFARHSAADAFSVKITKHGGFTRSKRIAGIAEAAGITLFGGTMIEGQIGTSAYAQFFSTLPNLKWGCQLFGPHLLTDDVASTVIQFENYEMIVPTAPGFGTEIDEEKLEFYRRS